jgi:hypothetical protein
MKSGDLKLAYLMVASPLPNVFVGGLMVTDSRGLPLEFRYSEPIQPTKIQQVLYGQVLSSYIKREVIMDTLLKSVETKFRCLLVEDESFADAAFKSFPVVRIGTTKSSPIGEAGKVQEISPQEVLLQLTAGGSPVRVYRQNGKAPPVEGADEQWDPTPVLLEAGQSMDVCEPLKRIEKALEIICQEAGISQGAK